MSNWQITARTIFCEAVDDEVTVMVYKDASVRCTGCNKYTKPNEITRDLVKQKTGLLKRMIRCEGESCQRVTGYKTAILAEETGR